MTTQRQRAAPKSQGPRKGQPGTKGPTLTTFPTDRALTDGEARLWVETVMKARMSRLRSFLASSTPSLA